MYSNCRLKTLHGIPRSLEFLKNLNFFISCICIAVNAIQRKTTFNDAINKNMKIILGVNWYITDFNDLKKSFYPFESLLETKKCKGEGGNQLIVFQICHLNILFFLIEYQKKRLLFYYFFYQKNYVWEKIKIKSEFVS